MFENHDREVVRRSMLDAVFVQRCLTKQHTKVLLNAYRSQWKRPVWRSWDRQLKEYEKVRASMAYFRRLRQAAK